MSGLCCGFNGWNTKQCPSSICTGKRVDVERDDSSAGNPKCVHLKGRSVEIVENIDRWPGSDHCYFKVRGDDGNLYILRVDEPHDRWELVMFQSPNAVAGDHARRQH